jgi:AraC-like DNA-binding protein
MQYFSVSSLPRIRFAHTHEADSYDVCLHKFNHTVEITYLNSGTLTLVGGGNEYTVNAGDIICNLYREDLQVRSDGFHAHRTVCFSVELSPSAPDAPDALAIPVVTAACDRSDECLHLIREIIRIHTLYPQDHLRCSGLFLELLNELGNINRHAENNTGEFRYVKGSKKYVYEHIHHAIHQRDVAAHLGITPEYLCAIFKKSEGMTLMHFINTVKLSSIRSLMEKEGLTLSQAAQRYGYADPNYVSRLYKQYFHINITDAVQRYPYVHALSAKKAAAAEDIKNTP